MLTGLVAMDGMTHPDKQTVEQRLKAIDEFRELFRANLSEGTEFGTTPGTDRPTLLKPGAENTTKLMMCSDNYEIIGGVQDWDRPSEILNAANRRWHKTSVDVCAVLGVKSRLDHSE